MINRSTAPEFKDIEQVKLFEPVKENLSNGINLFIFNTDAQDLVRIEWVFNNISPKGSTPLLNMALGGMLIEGTKSLESAEIAEKVDFYGAFLQPEYSFDHTSLTLYVLNKYVDFLLPVIKDILTNSIFPEQELKTYKRNNRQSLSVSLEKNDFVARRVFNKTIFGDNRYGFSPDLVDYKTLEQEPLINLSNKQIVADNCTMFVSGKVSSEIISSIHKIFGDEWERTGEPLEDHPYIFDINPNETILIEKNNALQSAIRIGCRTVNRAHEDFSSLQLVNTILGGYFGSRLMSNIREEKGYTYGIGSGIGSLKHSAFFTIATEVGINVTQATLDEIHKEMDKLRTDLMPIDELNLVKNYMNGAFIGSLENIFSHVDKFKNVHFIGLDLHYYTRHLQKIKESTPEDVLAIANKYLNFSEMSKVIVGKI
ncbi:M16 family metallopeptidase [Olivibacter domesticus]|uniref:Predicted Zn-dependent peptidase n=1 Tax=Olivibacter domesticus TaxID=407022 RepID=A0A1H7J0A7_OLID1|nr:pitrilysin family protein [Olivibacter domesticus]SEK66515.1 Predicted Zn-dependent peptidase [Olivibacter domesticus]